MLALNAMSHEPHGFSASMVATGRKPTLPPDVQHDAQASPSVDDPTAYVEVLNQRLKLTHQQMATPPPPNIDIPYQEGSLIFTMTTPPERANKLTPRWKGPYRVRRIPNHYQVVYEDGSVWRTVHINHTKQPLTFQFPLQRQSLLGQHLGIFQQDFLGSRPRHPPPPPTAAAPAEGRSLSPTASVPAPQPSAPTASEMPPPTPAPANQNSETTRRPRRSPRLNPELDWVCTIKSPPGTLAPQSQNSLEMARTYPLFVSYNQCLGAKEDPCSFASLCLEDLRNGRTEYLTTLKQLVDALPKTENPASRFALRGHIAQPGQQRLRHSMRATLWWLLPSDGEFRRASHSLQYYLARQGRRVVLQGGDVTRPFYENRLHWPPAPRRLDDLASPTSDPAIPSPPSEAHPRLPRCLRLSRRRKKRTAATANENSAPARLTSRPRLLCQPIVIQPVGLPAQRPNPGHQPMTFQESSLEPGVPQWSIPRASPPLRCHSIPSQQPIEIQNADLAWTTLKSEGVYKPARNDPRQDSTANRQRDNFSGFGLSSPALQQPPTKPFSGLPSRQHLTDPTREAREAGRQRPGIVYPLPRAVRPDTRLVIDAALPEAAALDRCGRPPTVVDIPEPGRTMGNCLPGPSQQRGSSSPRSHSCKRPRNRSSGVYRPKKRSPHRGHWCE